MNYIEELERIAAALKEEAAKSDRERESFEFAARMVNAAKKTLKSIEFRQAAQRHFLWVMNMSELVIYEQIKIEQQALAVAFSTDGGINSIIEQITTQAREKARNLDAETPKGRKELASIAYSVSKTKTWLDEQGKNLVSEAKSKIKVVDNERKAVRDQLDLLRDEIRKPVTDFEDAERKLLENAKQIKNLCESLKTPTDEFGNLLSSAQIKTRLDSVNEIIIDDNQYQAELKDIVELTQLWLKNLLHSVDEQEKQAEEIKRIQAEEAAKAAEAERIARDERIAFEAAERERKAAEAEIAKVQKEAEQAIENERKRIEQERKSAKLEQERKAAIEKARSEDKENRRIINRKALEAFIENNIEAEVAKSVLKLIVNGNIPNVLIHY